MKKLSKIITFTFGLFITANQCTFADLATDKKTTFYFSIGAGMLNQAKSHHDQFNMKNASIQRETYSATSTNLDYPKRNIVVPFVAAGYYLKDNLRLEAAFLVPIAKDIQISKNFTIRKDSDRSIITLPIEVKHIANINALQLRVYFDALPIKEYGSLYIATGAGFGQIQTTKSVQINAVTNRQSLTKYSPNWMLGCGVNLNIAQGIKLGLGYEFYNFGKGKLLSPALYITSSTRTFKGSGATLRLIYDI
jgi:opacity protein-like surface antigen